MTEGPQRGLRVAVWQCESRPLDVDGNLRRIAVEAEAARDARADLLVCPEMVLTGYDIGRDAVQRLAERADGPSAQAVAGIAARFGIAICHGFPERGDAGTVYNAARIVSADGRVLGHHRKTHLFGDLDRAVFTPGAGDAPLASLHGWRLGVGICYDIEFPEHARRLAMAGADAIVVPTANMAEFDAVPRILLPARALENQVYVAYANFCGTEGRQRYGGLSCVVAPDGTLEAGAERAEALLIADFDAERLAASRRVFTYLQDRRGGF